ncbi:MAG: hypothetical protein ACUVUQ_11795 [Thermodesulfovibrionales bacterium]
MFEVDTIFSKHKDILLKEYWSLNSFEGRFVLAGSEFLQKTHGIDIILQDLDDSNEIKIDTKHVRGSYDSLYLEEMSCSVEGKEKKGWILKEDGWPDLIFYAFWPICRGCYEDCFSFECKKPAYCEAFVCKFELLRKWFIQERELYKYHVNEFTVNKTSGRIVPINVLVNEAGFKRVGIINLYSIAMGKNRQ